MLIKCVNDDCNEMFESTKNKKFCSPKCRKSILKIKAVEKDCERCGRKIITSINYKHRRFCSRDCSIKSTNITKISFCTICGKELSVTNTTNNYKYCSKECRHIGVKKITLNEKYFDKIDSHDKAYWLGFLFADGYNSNKDIVIALKDDDIEQLGLFKQDIECNVDIKHKSGYNAKTKKITHNERLCVNSVHMCNSLSRLGMVRCKSKILKFPNIEKQFIPAFIRGVFDGDGCIHIKNRVSKKGLDASFSIYSESPEFLIGLQNAFNLFDITIGIRANVIMTGNLSIVKKIFQLLYNKDCNRKLERKYDKFKKWLDSRI